MNPSLRGIRIVSGGDGPDIPLRVLLESSNGLDPPSDSTQEYSVQRVSESVWTEFDFISTTLHCF
jgi:hypothetical protein